MIAEREARDCYIRALPEKICMGGATADPKIRDVAEMYRNKETYPVANASEN